MQRQKTSPFTLIELLVVVAIITILAGLLLPVLGKAREKARQANCLGNEKQIGMALMMYADSFGDLYPMAYYYPNDTNSNDGYVHWSGMIKNFMEDGSKAFVCGSHRIGGWAPTTFGPAGAETGVTATGKPVTAPAGSHVDGTEWQQQSAKTANDDQAPRMSYTPNELFMPRKKYSALTHLKNVKIGSAKAPSGEILMGEYTDELACLMDSSTTGGVAVKSHRPTAGVVYGSGTAPYDGEGQTSVTEGDLQAVTVAEAETARNNARNAKSASGETHLLYNQWDIHGGGTTANYVFADGHCEARTLADTLNPDNFLWGKKLYSHVDEVAVYKPDGSEPVK